MQNQNHNLPEELVRKIGQLAKRTGHGKNPGGFLDYLEDALRTYASTGNEVPLQNRIEEIESKLKDHQSRGSLEARAKKALVRGLGGLRKLLHTAALLTAALWRIPTELAKVQLRNAKENAGKSDTSDRGPRRLREVWTTWWGDFQASRRMHAANVASWRKDKFQQLGLASAFVVRAPSAAATQDPTAAAPSVSAQEADAAKRAQDRAEKGVLERSAASAKTAPAKSESTTESTQAGSTKAGSTKKGRTRPA